MKELSGKSLLITGGSGLIGSNLIRVLPDDCRYVAPSHAELPDARAYRELPKFDYIIHAAGYAQPARFLSQPTETAFLGTTALMALLTKLNPGGKLLFLSTSEVYAGSNRNIHGEEEIGTSLPNSPRGMYIEAKRCGEAICHHARPKGATAIVARVSLAYGPGCLRNDRRVMSEFIESAITNRSIELMDGGAARRTYCYVGDIVDMLLTILTRGTNSVYNVGGISDVSIHGLATAIGRIMHVPVKVPRNSTQAMHGAPNHVTLDMSRYRREFGEREYVTLDEGLRRTIEWHRVLHGEGVAA